MSDKRRRNPLNVQIGEAVMEPMDVPVVEGPPLVLDVPKVPEIQGEPLVFDMDEIRARALRNMARGRR